MSKTTALKTRLIIMNFLQFAVWGSWLISLGAYLGGTLQFTGIQIGGFFATIKDSIAIYAYTYGSVADKWIPAGLGLCSATSFAGSIYDLSASQTSYTGLYTFILLSVCFYMPTLGLTNAVAYSKLGEAGLDSVKHFPPIRVFGTIGYCGNARGGLDWLQGDQYLDCTYRRSSLSCWPSIC